MKMKKEKIRFKPLAAVVFVVVLAAVMLASALISAKAAPLTWQDICNRGESDLTAVAAYDLKAGCKDYGWNQTLDAGPDGTIYTGTNHHYDNVVGNELSRVMYAHKLRVADGMTVSIVAAQNDTEDEGGLTYIKGNNSGNNLYFYWSMGEYDADGNVVFDGDWRGVNESWTVGHELNHSSYGASGYPSGISQSDRASRVAYISVLGTFFIAAVKRRQEQNFNEYGEPVNVDTDHRCNEAVRTIFQALSLYAVSYCITLILWLAYKIVHMP